MAIEASRDSTATVGPPFSRFPLLPCLMLIDLLTVGNCRFVNGCVLRPNAVTLREDTEPPPFCCSQSHGPSVQVSRPAHPRPNRLCVALLPPRPPAIRLIRSLPPRLPVALDLILAIGALILLGVMIHSLVSRIFRPPLFADRKSPKWFKHLFPFCIFPLFIMFPEPVKRPVMRQRKNTWSVLSF